MKLRSTFYNLRSSDGFIALISAIIIAVVLLIFVVGAGAGGFYTRFDIFGSEIKETSFSLAEACIQTAILEIFQDPTYSGNKFVPVGTEQCKICPYSGSNPIRAQAVYEGSYTNLEADINSDYEITDLREVANLSC